MKNLFFLFTFCFSLGALGANARDNAAVWHAYLDAPLHYTEFTRSQVKTATHTYPKFTLEVYRQANGPKTFQRVFMTIPREAPTPLPAVVVPFYFPEATLGFNPTTHSYLCPLAPAHTNLLFYAGITYLADLAKRGYIAISADAAHLTYLPESDGRWNAWQAFGEALARDWPSWTGIGKLTFDTRLLVDALQADTRVDTNRIGIIGHSLGGKMAFYAGCLDTRIKVIVTSDWGAMWDSTNWKDVWYWGVKLPAIRAQGLDHASLWELGGCKPLCLIAGKYDTAATEKLFSHHPANFLFINHATGHRPTPTATLKGYEFLDKYLKN